MIAPAPLRVILAAVFGSVSGGVTWYLICGAPGDRAFFSALGFGSVIFTLPGALMLVLLQYHLLQRKLPKLPVGGALLITGGIVGGLILGLFGLLGQDIYTEEVQHYAWLAGAVFGAMTAIPLLVLKPCLEVSPSTTR